MANVVRAGKSIVAANTKASRIKPTIKKTATKKNTAKKTVKAATRKSPTRRKNNYLTKRILVSAATTGFIEASERTMRVMGENVIVKDGWVVRIFADGRIERISKIDSNNNKHLALD